MKKFWAIVIGLVLAIFCSRIFLINPITQIIGDGGDNFEYFGFQYLVKENIQNLKYPLAHTNTFRYPVGFDLSYGYDGVLAVFSGALLGLVLPQTLAFNLSLVVILFLNFFLSYLFFEKISRSFWLGTIGAIIYGFSFYVLARINSHLNLAFVGGWPALGYALWNLYQKSEIQKSIKFGDIFLVFLGVLLIAFGSLQYLVMLTESFIIAGLIVFLIDRNLIRQISVLLKNLWQKHKKQLIVSGLIFFIIFLFFYCGFLINDKVVFIKNIDKDLFKKYNQPTISDLFIPNQFLGSIWKKINPSSLSIEKVASIGLVEWVLLIWLFFSLKSKKLRLILTLSLLFFLVILLGFLEMPFAIEGGRWVVVFSLIFCGILVGKDCLKNKWIILAIFFLMLTERALASTLVSNPPSSQVSRVIKNQPGQAILSIPLSKYVSYRDSFPYFFEKKIIDGYFHWTAENPEANSFFDHPLIGRYICSFQKLNNEQWDYHNEDLDATLDLLKQNEINTIVVHKNHNKDFFFHADCENVRYWWTQLNPPKFYLSQPNPEVKAETMEITSQSFLKSEIFFEKAGKFQLDGLSIYPPLLNQTKIVLPDKKEISLNWEEINEGIRTSFIPRMELEVKSGEVITIYSNQRLNESIYLTIFYTFEPETGLGIAKPAIDKIYSDNDYEVYAIN